MSDSRARQLARDAAVVLAWFVVAGLVGALVWWQVTPLAEYTRTVDNAEMGETELGRRVSADGWFFVVAAVGGLLSGVVLLARRRRDPVVMVLLVGAGGLLAAWLMSEVGLWLGPPDPGTVLPGVDVGDRVPVQLELGAPGLLFVWPIAALLGAVGVLWGLDDYREHDVADADLSDPVSR